MRAGFRGRVVGLVLAMGLAGGPAARAEGGAPAAGGVAPGEPAFHMLALETPRNLPRRVERAFMKELTAALERLAPGSKPSWLRSAGVVAVRATPAQAAAMKSLAAELEKRLASQPLEALARIQDLGEVDHGEEVDLEFQLLFVSTDEGDPAMQIGAIDETLEERFGYRSYEIAALASGIGVVGEESHLATRVPWEKGTELGLSFDFAVRTGPAGVPLVELTAGIRERRAGEKGRVIGGLAAEVSTTFRPRNGLPSVLGHWPLDGDRGLLLVVTARGPGVE